MEDVETGGFAPLIEAFMILLKFYEKDKHSGQEIMHKLLPPHGDPTRPEFLMYNMAAKMSKTGKAPPEIFKMMDEDGGGTLSYPEFLEGMQTKLDVMFSNEECEEMMKLIDADGSGEIDMNEFIENLQALIYKSYPKDRWTVTKTHLIQAIIE